MINEKKKMTAQSSSVGADDGQSISQNSKTTIPDPDEKSNSPGRDLEELYRKMRRMSDPAYLHTVTLDELMDNVFEGKSAVIENLLYTGAYILAGAPKIGKSFLVAQIAHHVSSGQDLWGYKVHQGTVLYLALEDDYARLQKRLSQMFGMEGSEDFYLATKSKSLHDGLERQLVTFVTEHKDARLIIIDTLQKVREVGGDKFSYASDYEIVTKLKAFSDKYGICFLVVHHTRKMESSDSFDMISGTNGLLGAADGGDDLGAHDEGVLHVGIHDEVDVALAVAHFGVDETLVLVGQRTDVEDFSQFFGKQFRIRLPGIEKYSEAVFGKEAAQVAGYDFGAACRECIVIKGDGFDLHTRNLMFKSNKLF